MNKLTPEQKRFFNRQAKEITKNLKLLATIQVSYSLEAGITYEFANSLAVKSFINELFDETRRFIKAQSNENESREMLLLETFYNTYLLKI